MLIKLFCFWHFNVSTLDACYDLLKCSMIAEVYLYSVLFIPLFLCSIIGKKSTSNSRFFLSSLRSESVEASVPREASVPLT